MWLCVWLRVCVQCVVGCVSLWLCACVPVWLCGYIPENMLQGAGLENNLCKKYVSVMVVIVVRSVSSGAQWWWCKIIKGMDPLSRKVFTEFIVD